MEDLFQWKLFDDEGEYEETPLRDRKANFPDLNTRANPEGKAELIRDAIALANTARLLGKPAYLLFGIDNNGDFVGINFWLDVYRNATTTTLREIREKVRAQLSHLFGEYIRPSIAFEIKMAERNGLQAAYLLIQPLAPLQPFQVNRL